MEMQYQASVLTKILEEPGVAENVLDKALLIKDKYYLDGVKIRLKLDVPIDFLMIVLDNKSREERILFEDFLRENAPIRCAKLGLFMNDLDGVMLEVFLVPECPWKCFSSFDDLQYVNVKKTVEALRGALERIFGYSVITPKLDEQLSYFGVMLGLVDTIPFIFVDDEIFDSMFFVRFGPTFALDDPSPFGAYDQFFWRIRSKTNSYLHCCSDDITPALSIENIFFSYFWWQFINTALSGYNTGFRFFFKDEREIAIAQECIDKIFNDKKSLLPYGVFDNKNVGEYVLQFEVVTDDVDFSFTERIKDAILHKKKCLPNDVDKALLLESQLKKACFFESVDFHINGSPDYKKHSCLIRALVKAPSPRDACDIPFYFYDEIKSTLIECFNAKAVIIKHSWGSPYATLYKQAQKSMIDIKNTNNIFYRLSIEDWSFIDYNAL